ncbi:hypothetical protein LRY58_01535 [Candidatus Woesebacteria bacterium]|nr:hypothetical protein [Candidatus Woesebacteria bacterium]
MKKKLKNKVFNVPWTPSTFGKKARRRVRQLSQAVWSPKNRRRKWLQRSLIAATLVVAIFSYITNPFVRFSIVVDPYQEVVYENGMFTLEENDNLFVRESPFFSQLAKVKAGWHIVSSKFTGGQKAQERKVDEIIREIHADRFDPAEPFLISGDHFSVLYPRSLGIFYHSLLDRRTALDDLDWKNRQHIYLKTTAYALQVYSKSDRLSTTIVPVGPRSVALLNIYDLPSDTLYSLVFALQVMQDEETLVDLYPYNGRIDPAKELVMLETATAAAQLEATYADSLRRHWQTYYDYAYDEQTGFIRKDIRLSGTKDIVHRESALYDNIVFWRTAQLLQQLEVIEQDPAFLDNYKQRILDAYWLPEDGFFREDLSDESLENKYYSSDWMIAYQTGFLDPENPEDLPYLERSVAYIQRNAIDQPFGLQYHPDLRSWQLYLPVRLIAPTYASTAIWSHWGMEYTKLLAHLAQVTGDEIYIQQAQDQIEAYTYNIKRYRGYPEVYNDQGDFFRQGLYKSIRQTGWVVNYEQARDMVQWTRLRF